MIRGIGDFVASFKGESAGHPFRGNQWSGGSGQTEYNGGKPYYRYAKSDDPMSDYGHAMFSAHQEHYDPGSLGQGLSYYKFQPSADDARVTSFENVKPKITETLDDWKENGVPVKYSGSDIGNAVESGDYSTEDLAKTFNPHNIVDSAGAYDNSDFNSFLYDEILEPNGYGAIVTQDGAIVYDPSMIEKVTK